MGAARQTAASPPAFPGGSAAALPALLRRHPALRALPRAPFVPAPGRGSGSTGACFVKRDDRSCPLYGGNKPRKLEFVLGAAAARRTRRLVTTGGVGTHHGLATTVLGRSLGMATTVVCVPQPLTPHVREQLLAMHAHGAELRLASGVAGAAVSTALALARSALAGERPLLVPTGGTSALGDVGFVSAAFELAEQVEAGTLPAPAEIYVAVGSGGTLSGLLLGARLAGLRARIVGVLVTDILPPGERRVLSLARATLERLRRLDPSLPEVVLEAGDFEITRAQLGPGYGAPTAAGRAAAAAAAGLGLALETTYTAKCLAELLERLDARRARTPALFWNTFNSVPLCAPEGAPGPESLPAPLRAWLARAEAAP